MPQIRACRRMTFDTKCIKVAFWFYDKKLFKVIPFIVVTEIYMFGDKATKHRRNAGSSKYRYV